MTQNKQLQKHGNKLNIADEREKRITNFPFQPFAINGNKCLKHFFLEQHIEIVNRVSHASKLLVDQYMLKANKMSQK